MQKNFNAVVVVEGKDDTIRLKQFFPGIETVETNGSAVSDAVLAKLKKLGVNKLIILSGDRKEIVEDTREKLEMDEGYGELLPLDKLNMVEKIKKEGTLM